LLFLLWLTEVVSQEITTPSGYMRREYSLVKPFTGDRNAQWEFVGSSMSTNDYVRLTPDEQSKKGGIWNILQCHVRDWEIHIQFKVHGHGSRLFGDGFAFWYIKDKSQVGSVFGSADQFSGLGIFFDTYANQNGEHAHEHPYISAQVNNGSLAYDHDRDGTHSEVAGCTSYFRGVDTNTHVAIRYIGSKQRLTLQYDNEGEGKWQDCFDIGGVELPTGYHFGFSAATGDLSDNHDIISMKLYELDSSDPAADEEEGDQDYTQITPKASNAAPHREHVDDEKGSFSTRTQKFFWFLYALLLILVIGGIVSFWMYKKKQADSLKRFY